MHEGGAGPLGGVFAGSLSATRERNRCRRRRATGASSLPCAPGNLIGLILTATALGGLAPWSRWQFVGAFGAIEAASGLANVISPNIWRLPVAELETSARTHVKLAWSALLLPHWGGLARCAAGLVCLGVAAWQEGLGLASAALVPFVLALAWSILAISAVLARAGVARPEIDVVQLVVRWGNREKEMRPLSLGAVLPPSVLYQPELAPSVGALLIVMVLSTRATSPPV